MIRIKVKPLSVNEAWQGKRFKTIKYTTYENYVLCLLPDLEVPPGKLQLNINYGFSSKLSDVDNPTKLVLDILQKRYNFNDRDIFRIILNKEIVSKNDEYFEFNLEKYLHD